MPQFRRVDEMFFCAEDEASVLIGEFWKRLAWLRMYMADGCSVVVVVVLMELFYCRWTRLTL